MTTAKAGLEDVVAANSAICEIIGSEGKLTYRGIDIHELARHSSFEETTYLLWFGSLPAEASLRQFSADLAARRRLPQEVIGLIERFPRHGRPMDVLRTAVSALPLFAPPVPPGPEADVERAMRVTAHMATIVAALLAARQKVYGFGHRVYRTGDPRVTHLREMSRRLGQQKGDLRWYEISRRVEEVVLERKRLYPNVDFYSASCYFSMGIPVDMFTPVFAVSRISGWAAHVLEQYADNRLIRPRAEYVGERNLPYTPMDQRVAAAS